ncbi:aminotransferase class III-fold pyridoxal phosphate-dependent enzyme [Mesorhizobium atlanticum]
MVGAGLTALPAFHAGFGIPFEWQHKIPSPYPYRNPVGEDGNAIARRIARRAEGEDRGDRTRKAGRRLLRRADPGLGRRHRAAEGWIKAIRELCKEYRILFIADEVITGFGRTGPLFACSDEDIVPDFMTTAKGLTSGYVPMGAVFMADHVYQVIADGAGASAVGHGYTYSAHPVSAAVALEVLKLDEGGGLLENGIKAGARLMAGLACLSDHPLVGDVRGRAHAGCG